MDYKSAGVDIEAGNRFAELIGQIDSPAVGSAIGGFAGAVPLEVGGMREPVLLSSTDGVGTKLLVARRLRTYDTVGIDLVAMCVNDLAVAGAHPVQFLDYIACGRVDQHVLRQIVLGVVSGCEQAGCRLAGGETAELPDMYGPEDFDLAGFAVGVADRHELLPKRDRLVAGAPLYGIPSSGIHSNGFSLARKALADAPAEHYRMLLEPTRIYVNELSVLLAGAGVIAAAHITGGGLVLNLHRVVDPFVPVLTWDWPVPSIFREIQARGNVAEEEMCRVFNMGIGIALAVEPDQAPAFERLAQEHDIAIHRIGELRNG